MMTDSGFVKDSNQFVEPNSGRNNQINDSDQYDDAVWEIRDP